MVDALRPSDCGKCRKLFMANEAMQIEAIHIAHTAGLWGAESYIDAKLEEAHIDHTSSG